MEHQQIISLAIAYTLAGAVVFTVIVTCLSLVGWIKLADSKQQNKLFYVLIVELIAISVTFFGGFLNFNPVQVQTRIENAAVKTRVEQIALEATNSYDDWMKNYRHPENKSDNEELLDWLHADRGALKIAEDYEIFVKMANELSGMGYTTDPPPLEFEFEQNIREYKRNEEWFRNRQ